MKHFLLTIICLGGIALGQAQNDMRAVLEFSEAEEAYEAGDLNKALEHLQEIDRLVPKGGPHISYLKIEVYSAVMNDDFTHEKTDQLYEEVKKYMKYLNSLDVDDVPVQKLQKVGALEKALEQYRREQAEKEKQAYAKAKLGRVEDMRYYIRNYPNDPKNKEIVADLDSLEEQLYDRVQQEGNLTAINNYLSAFESGKYAVEVKQLQKKAVEERDYRLAMEAKSWQPAFTYVKIHGHSRPDVLVVMEQRLLEAGGVAMVNNNYKEAEELYSKYLQYAPDGSEVALAKSNLEIARAEIRKQEKIAARKDKTYFMLTYHTDKSFGIEIGGLKNSHAPAFYGGLKLTPNFLKAGFTDVYDIENDPEYLETFELAPIFIAVDLGVNVKISHPLWIYGGLAGRMRHHLSGYNDQLYRIEGEKDFSFYPEAGIKVLLGRAIILKGGLQYVDSQINLQFGFGF